MRQAIGAYGWMGCAVQTQFGRVILLGLVVMTNNLSASNVADSSKPGTRTVRFIYVEDHEVTRLGALHVLKSVAPNVEVIEISRFKELEELAQRGVDADLLILDLFLPDVDGMVHLGSVQALYPEIPIVVFSGYDDPQVIMRLIFGGVAGVILKQSPTRTIIKALQLVLDGEVYFPRQFISQYVDSPDAPPRSITKLPVRVERPSGTSDLAALREGAPPRKLTPRQQEILALVAMGKSNKEIAKQLDISSGTVKNHVAELLRILGFNNRRDAMRKVGADNKTARPAEPLRGFERAFENISECEVNAKR